MQIYTADFQNTQVARSYYGMGTVTPMPYAAQSGKNERIDKTACRFCGGYGDNCCASQDRAQISSEARQRLEAANPAYAINENSDNNIEHNTTDTETLLPNRQVTLNPDAVTPSPDNSQSSLNPEGQGGSSYHSQDADKDEKDSDANAPKSELSEDEKEKVDELKKRDQKVRQHEQAHLAAAGHLANGGPQFETEKGPDGNSYAVGGHVNISVGGGDTPEERLQNAKQAERAALAPAEPSSADRKVASAARQKANKAQQEISEEQSNDMQSVNKTEDNTEQEISFNSIFDKNKDEKESSENGVASVFGKSNWIVDQYAKQSNNQKEEENNENQPNNNKYDQSTEKLSASVLAFA